MTLVIVLILSHMLAATLGFFIAALMAAAKREDNR